MPDTTTTNLMLIRHAPVMGDGRAYGRRDLPADCSDSRTFTALRDRLPAPDRIVASPALRCLQTAARIWPDRVPETLPALWEQDLGAWEDQPYDSLPDLGPMTREALATHCPPGGESFADLCARTIPALRALATGGDIAVVAHAGTIRAALAMATGTVPGALSFEIAPLSLTRITFLPGDGFVIREVSG
ncbi:histidine phosphatase family protein [Actibacterium sp. XHP0104]|uniref:histidine phosphatase family protein n=1 Tax=Actibacterium sp. XHP0104 TaxID=2984335 RepID=UPI0021E6F2B1|nr:histidine phosphatase family protein [Actibacterium sp. XHP0104]MCV2882726.1 histidine phosphatase family protein [Actibacterium sp. XHP0104]